MAYRPRQNFGYYFEAFLKGYTHFYIGGIKNVSKYIHDAVREKMEREPNGMVENMQQHWKNLPTEVKDDFESGITMKPEIEKGTK